MVKMAEKKIYGEKYLERKLGEEIRKIGGWSVKLPAYLLNGLPDRLILLPGGRVLFAEIKTTGAKITPVQATIHAKLRTLGFVVVVVDSYQVIEQIIGAYEEY